MNTSSEAYNRTQSLQYITFTDSKSLNIHAIRKIGPILGGSGETKKTFNKCQFQDGIISKVIRSGKTHLNHKRKEPIENYSTKKHNP